MACIGNKQSEQRCVPEVPSCALREGINQQAQAHNICKFQIYEKFSAMTKPYIYNL